MSRTFPDFRRFLQCAKRPARLSGGCSLLRISENGTRVLVYRSTVRVRRGVDVHSTSPSASQAEVVGQRAAGRSPACGTPARTANARQKPMTRNTAVTVRLPGASTAPVTRTRALCHIGAERCFDIALVESSRRRDTTSCRCVRATHQGWLPPLIGGASRIPEAYA